MRVMDAAGDKVKKLHGEGGDRMKNYVPHGYQQYVKEKMIELPFMGAWLD